MKLSRLALVAALAAVWAVFPPLIRAEDDAGGDEKETVEINKRVRHDDREGERRERREGMGGRGGHEERHGRRDDDPEMNAKFEAVRDLEEKLRGISRNLRQGTDEEKAAAKAEARKTLGELFDAKLALETAMLAKMEKHAAELKARLAKKKASREKAIESRLARMTGDADEWE